MIRVDETDPVGEVEPSFPYRDVTVRRGVDFKDNYDIQSEIGRGKFGTVYHCKEKTSGLLLAAKVVTTTRKEDRRSVEREVEIMRRLQHPRLIQLYDAIDTGKQIYVILELIQGGELFERVIDDDFVLTERSCAVFMRQICEGIEFVHAQHILHLDMKPENILCLTKEGNRIKIIDFGLARHYDPRKKMQVLFGTPEFVAPEVVNFDQIGFGTDMWSIGVICYVLLSGLSPFMGDTDVETMANVTIAKYDFDHDAFADISEDAKDFIRCLLVKDKEKRATATMCRSHRWLAPKIPVPRKPVDEVKFTKIETAMSPKTTETRKPELTSSQMPGTSKNELDVTKDNLRLFVERWREHPDSPYLLETEAIISDDRHGACSRSEDHRRAIGELRDNNNLESMSLRGQSPSPCGSVTSTSSKSSENILTDAASNCVIAPTNQLVLGLERRASEGNFANTSGHRRDQAAQIVLAEEIIKLSEHLRNLASGRTASGAQVEPDATTNGTTGRVYSEISNCLSSEVYGKRSTNGASSEVYGETMKDGPAEKRRTVVKTNGVSRGKGGTYSESKLGSSRDSEVAGVNESNEISEKLSSITRQRKIKGTTFNGSRSYSAKSESKVKGYGLRKTFNETRSSEVSLDERNDGNHETADRQISSEGNLKIKNRDRVTWRIENEDQDTSEIDRISGEAQNNAATFKNCDIDLTPPWRRARTKHRFGETCRDVPRISNLRDIHKSLNLDEPKSTKDLLLHLLGELEDTTRPGGVGRKSVSVDWCGEESVARRSMNSLAEYFQSEQQKSTSSCTNDPGSSSSVHR